MLGFHSDKAQERLGLVQQAVTVRTRHHSLDGITSDEALFKYLMDNVIAYKDSLKLTVGESLSAEQVAALTHDIVWMEQSINWHRQ